MKRKNLFSKLLVMGLVVLNVGQVQASSANDTALKLYYDMLSQEKILTLQESISSNYTGTGIINASVLDFDNDGVSELFLLSKVDKYREYDIQVYTTINNELKLANVETIKAANDTIASTYLIESQGSYYIYNYTVLKPEWFSELYYFDNGEIKKDFLYELSDMYGDDPIYEMNGRAISETEYRQYYNEIKQMLNDGKYLYFSGGAAGAEAYTEGSDAQSIYNATQTLNQLKTQVSQMSSQPTTTQASTPTVDIKDMTITINGAKHTIKSCEIDNTNYVYVRDFAEILSQTSSPLEVAWNSNTSSIELISNDPTIQNFTETARTSNSLLGTSNISKDNQVITLQTYTKDGNTYFKLRDLAGLAGVSTTWDATNGTVIKLD
ncbi:MAG: hypothetical protein ATN35_08810 [Epulopiscium sp. Nele67-Bin004]|nr:MAG: hypothetical protein ATN35_08810 [Epulopiscium sp. Nele67-Bin004]